MVASGLEGDAIYVNPTRLAIHFVSALGLISYAFWFALQLSVPPKERINDPALRKWVYAILTVLFFQLIYGALMAGLKAATAAPTWPDINGSLLPGNLFYERPLILNFVENKSTIHFIHRMLAYLLLILISVFVYKTSRVSYAANYFNKARITVLVLVIVQVLLGISSVLTSVSSVPGKWGVFEWLAQLHQVIGMLLLLNLMAVLYLLTKKSAGTAQ
jgi:cytochrome c oxidase assembly protein subunit 15